MADTEHALLHNPDGVSIDYRDGLTSYYNQDNVVTISEDGWSRTDYLDGTIIIDWGNNTMTQIFPNRTIVTEFNLTLIDVK